MGIGIETRSTAPVVEGSLGSGGPARGIASSTETTVKKSDIGPAYKVDLSGVVTIQTGKGPGGKTSLTFQTPEPTTPLKRVDLNA